MIAPHKAHTYKYTYIVPAIVRPIKAAIPNSTIKAISPPFPPFLVDTDTIPPASIKNAAITPAVPLDSPVLNTIFTNPAAQD